MTQSDKSQSAEDTDVQVLVIVERIEGKIDRMNDRVKLNSERIEALLDVVTGHKDGGRSGLVVRVHDLEQKQEQHHAALEEMKKNGDRMDVIEDKLDQVLRMQSEHPPFLWLLRFQTRKTVLWIVLIFAILTLIWASDVREAVLSLLLSTL
jgi:hypothetical protein